MQLNSKFLIKPRLILLDVYGTILDMSEVDKKVNRLLDSKRGYEIWFDLLLKNSFVDNCTVQFNNFMSVAKSAMQMAAGTLGRTVEDTSVNEVLELLKYLPVHNGVQEGLSLLHNHGFRVAALTNSSQNIVINRMERTGLISYFEIVLSAEQVKKYKPCLEVYEWAAGVLKVEIQDVLLVSSHGWDIAGANNAGMQTALINYAGRNHPAFTSEPTMVCSSLEDLSIQLKRQADLKMP